MITYNGNFEWTNSTGKIARLTDEGYYGFNGKINPCAPGNTAELVNAILNSTNDDNTIVEILNTMFNMNPFYPMQSTSTGYCTYRHAINGIRAMNNYKNTPLERIVHVIMNKWDLPTTEERAIVVAYRDEIESCLAHFEEAEIINYINNCPMGLWLCKEIFSHRKIMSYISFEKLHEYLPPNTPQDLIEWGSDLLIKYPEYPQAIATMIRNGIAQIAKTKYNNTFGRDFTNIPSMFLYYAKLLNIENPNPNGNLLNKIHQMHLEYESRKDEIIAARIKKQAKKMQYHAHGFCVVVPITKAEFKAEADAQNNCLYNFNYFNKVADGRTNIAFVRKDDNPETPFVTCEIDNRGQIVQFYTKNNNTPHGENIAKFRKEWQKHLRETFNS